MKIEFYETPNLQDVDLLTQKINQETSGYGSSYPFSFFIRDDNNKIIAGVNGYVIYGSIYTDQLWVEPNYRKQGLASSLMKKVHEFGLQSSCKLATVQTMSFQDAKVFYEKLGYRVDFERSGYKNSSSCLFLQKIL